MGMLHLIIPDMSWAAEIAAYRDEMLAAGSSMDGCGPLRRCETPAEWLNFNERLLHQETLPNPDLPTSTQYIYVRESDHRIVGMLQIRHELTGFFQWAGHIGYSVRPSERRKGYATAMLRASLPFCRDLGLTRIMIACLQENEGSRRVILSNGGVYDQTVFEPRKNAALEQYWIELTPITLRRAKPEDAARLQAMQIIAFAPHQAKYGIGPGGDSLERVREKIVRPNSDFYIINKAEKPIGGIRIILLEDEPTCVLMQLFILPAEQHHGYAREAMRLAEKLYPQATHWKLDTIAQEAGLCRFYERQGYVRTGQLRHVQAGMDMADYVKTV